MDILRETGVPYIADNTSRSLIGIARDGVTFEEFDQLYKIAPFSLADWGKFLSISDRSLQRYQKSGQRFSLPVSEKLLKLSYLFNRGAFVFGDYTRFFNWVGKKSPALGGDTPQSYFDSMFGIDLILDELGRIEHGVFA